MVKKQILTYICFLLSFPVIVDGYQAYKIYDTAGKLIKEGKLVNNQNNIQELGEGVYVITLSNATKHLSGKIIRKN